MAPLPLHNKEQGFTLIETIIATALILTSIVGIYGLGTFNFRSAQASRDQFIAASLGQEGIEVIQALRYRNWLMYPDDPSKWLDYNGISGGLKGTHRVQSYSGQGNALLLDPDANIPLSMSSNGYYNYDTGGKPTKFFREVKVTSINANTALVSASVTWQEGPAINTFVAKDHLTNWQ